MDGRRKLIEVALPLEAINKASAREKSIRHGHPSTLHLWWARRPLAAARAVIFAQMVDDPSSHPDIFRTEKAQDKERQRLFRIIEELVQWENTTNEEVLDRARAEIWQSWRAACADNADHPRAKELFNRHTLPAFHDPFAGGGSLPLEAQRLGLKAYASDLNPVAVLINKAMIEIPPKFAGRPPVGPVPEGENQVTLPDHWRAAAGLAEDVRRYGQWMRDEAEKRLGDLYPKVEITAEMAKARPDLGPLVGQKFTVIAWLWARTVKSPNPAFAQVTVPLVSSFMLSSKPSKEAYVEPVIEAGDYYFAVRVGKPKHAEAAKGERRRVYLAPTLEHETVAGRVHPEWRPETPLASDPRALWTPAYGLTSYGDLFTARQLIVLTTCSDLLQEVRERVRRDAMVAGMPDDNQGLASGGHSATAYAEAVTVYLAFVVEKLTEAHSTICTWSAALKNELVVSTFRRQGLPMTWDFAEANPFADSSGSITKTAESVARVVWFTLGVGVGGEAAQADAAVQQTSSGKVVSTDPPYYDNIGYADLSDFFYVWLRRSLRSIFPDLFATLAVPKAEELVASPYRHGSKEKAEEFFLDGMTRAMHRLAEQAHLAFPVTVYYAFKQSESETDAGLASTGWETFLDAVIRAGLAISGTWPVRTEREGRSTGIGSNALASSIVLVCRPRRTDAPTATRREFLVELKAELPVSLAHLQRGNIAPVDLAQAAIGPGMAVYTRYARVLDAEGKPLSVRGALALINQTLDETLAEQEGDFDADSRFAVTWFGEVGFAEGEFGQADVLARAKNTSVSGMAEAGILVSKGGKVRLLKPSQLPADWDPATDSRLNAWEMVHHLIRLLELEGERAAAELVAKLGSKTEVARELAYRLYTISDRRKRSTEALSYNGLVQSWPEISRLAREAGGAPTEQPELFDRG